MSITIRTSETGKQLNIVINKKDEKGVIRSWTIAVLSTSEQDAGLILIDQDKVEIP